MTDMMVDTETMGNDNPEMFGCFQVSAIKFNAKTGAIGETFDRCPAPLPNRVWTGDTREFWMGRNRETYTGLVARQEDGWQVWKDFVDYARRDAPAGGFRFWAKPITFDWAVVSSHVRQVGLMMPFHYRLARDLNSYMAALIGTPEHPNMESRVVNRGTIHNGLHDCAYQIDMLMEAQRHHIHAEII